MNIKDSIIRGKIRAKKIYNYTLYPSDKNNKKIVGKHRRKNTL